MPSFPLFLEKHLAISAKLLLLSGTKIGGSKEELEIGGMDNPVIRNPLTKDPYIPGSSLKGKLRTLLEYKYGKQGQEGRPCGCAQPGCPVCTLFGPHFVPNHTLGPSRLIVRDLPLTPESRLALSKLKDEGLAMVEVKSENIIDRRTGTAAQRGGPRSQERVPPGPADNPIKFELNMSVRVFRGDNADQLTGWIKEALSVLEKDTLGGSGTRGYGWVKIEDLKVSDA
ncbi:MAG: type III-A CRISPR-associated RAMP protein Csm3 [Chloroflexi bacterium]|nr:type III-A CRISPR-associated RAMP protein Csm3 [Chloroflexota bacterium]